MSFTENAIKVLERRYLTKDEKGNNIETIEEMFTRVARHVAQVDKIYNKDADLDETTRLFYDVMVGREFMPNSPTLMNAGRALGQLSACFVLPIRDSMEDIFDAVKNAALIHKSGGGTGFSFSRLRPKGSSVKSTGGVASGPVSFMKVFNAATEAVKQGGTRRGANMGILRVDHPDILEFIQCKKNNADITNFNISIGITEKFMKAVEGDNTYDLINPHDHKVVNTLRAREVFDIIVDMAWNNGEPGIIFLDRLNKDNVVPSVGEIESTNPCGEQPLLPFESCNLGSINLNKMLKEVGSGYEIDYDKLGQTVETAVHFLDNVIDANKYPLEEIERMTKSTRKIGLGVMGFADMLFKVGIPYNSDQAVSTAEKVMKFIRDRSREVSARLAQERGPFPLYDQSIYYEKGLKLRNATTTTIAPTGTISIICNATSGVEPLFAISFFRNVMDDDKLMEVHPYFKEIAQRGGFYSEELMMEIADKGSLAHVRGIPSHAKKVFVVAHDVSPKYHVKIQAAFQKYTDNAVSKTVNFPSEATRDDVREVYMLAYKTGCKGVTIYRDGSRESQVLNVGQVKAEAKANPKQVTEGGLCDDKQLKLKPRTRPNVTSGITEKVKIGCGNLYITVNYDDRGICEVFTNLGRAGGCPSQSEATSRLISMALRSGMDVSTIIEQLKGIRCHSTLRQNGLKVLSCPDAIGRVIEKVVQSKLCEKAEAAGISLGEASSSVQKHRCLGNCSLCSLKDTCTNPQRQNGGIYLPVSSHSDKALKYCPECSSKLEHEGGCVVCRSCGFSKCG